MDWDRMGELKVFYDGKDRIGDKKSTNHYKKNKRRENKQKKKLQRRIKMLAEANRIIKEHGLPKVRKPELKAAVLEQLSGIENPQWGYVNALPRIARVLQYMSDGTLAEKTGGQRNFTINDKLKALYASYDWKKLRYETILKYGAVCMACGSTRNINVDHIKPPRFFWSLRLDPNNVQILCSDCNHGKGNWDTTDWREKGEHSDDIALTVLDGLKK